MKPFSLSAIAGVTIAAVACNSSARDERAMPQRSVMADARPADSTSEFRVMNPELAAVPARDSVSAHPVNWTIDLVMQRLSSAGLSPANLGPVKVVHMNVAGSLVAIRGAELEVYLYGDPNAAARDIDRFDRLMAMPGQASAMWHKPPAIVTANNAVIVVLTTEAAVRERVRTVFSLAHLHPFQGSAQ